MTSASDLFHSRRYRSGLRPNAVGITGFDSSPADVTSSYQHRSTIRRHSQQNNRREHRHDPDGCIPASRRIHRRRPDHLEHQPEEGGSIINSDGFRSIDGHNRRSTGIGNERLPGSVLLARERLVERLRGVSVSGNRQNRGASSTSHQNVYSTPIVSEIRRSNNTTAEMVSESWQRNHPSGLDEDELKCLQLESFSSRENDETSTECTICLEGFEDGDKIVCLVCMHRFHSCCLFPWVRSCGACPNCRKPVLINVPVK